MTALTKAISILSKLIPVVTKVIRDVEAKIAADKAASSDGGSKVTPVEIAQIVADEIGPVVEALVTAIVSAVT
jgi:hypothetical protein